MATDISIVVNAKDNYTETMKKIRESQRAWGKDIKGLQQQLDHFNRQKLELKVEAGKAKQQLQDAQKAFKEFGDEASEAVLKAAQADYNTAISNLKAVEKAAKGAQSGMEQMSGTFSKTQNGIGGGDIGKFAAGMMVNQVGGAVQNAGYAMLSSALGDEAGTYATSVLGGAATGAAAGTMIAPGVGTIIGGAAGALTGLINAATQVFKNKDDAFKSLVQDKFQEATQEQVDIRTRGTGIAAQRERDLAALTTMLTDPTKFRGEVLGEHSAKFLQTSAINMSPILGYDFSMSAMKDMVGLGTSAQTAVNRVGSLQNAAAALQLDNSDLMSIMTTLNAIEESGTINKGALKGLVKKGINVYDYLAQSSGMSVDDVLANLDKVDAGEFVRMFYEYIATDPRFEGAADDFQNTFAGMEAKLQMHQDRFDAAMGQGYNDERMKGMEQQLERYEGAYGRQLEEAYKTIGQGQAALENELINQREDAMVTAMQQEGFDEMSAAEQGAALIEAQMTGYAEYLKSTGYQEQLDAHTELAGKIGSALKPVYQDAGYSLGQALSKGLKAVDGPTTIKATINVEGFATTSSTIAYGKAFGMGRVPYDDFPALLHEGERVLTAGEARRQDSGGAGGIGDVNINVDSLVVREDADVERIASKLVDMMKLAQLSYVGEEEIA